MVTWFEKIYADGSRTLGFATFASRDAAVAWATRVNRGHAPYRVRLV